jgi:hypothetical protein
LFEQGRDKYSTNRHVLVTLLFSGGCGNLLAALSL